MSVAQLELVESDQKTQLENDVRRLISMTTMRKTLESQIEELREEEKAVSARILAVTDNKPYLAELSDGQVHPRFDYEGGDVSLKDVLCARSAHAAADLIDPVKGKRPVLRVEKPVSHLKGLRNLLNQGLVEVSVGLVVVKSRGQDFIHEVQRDPQLTEDTQYPATGSIRADIMQSFGTPLEPKTSLVTRLKKR